MGKKKKTLRLLVSESVKAKVWTGGIVVYFYMRQLGHKQMTGGVLCDQRQPTLANNHRHKNEIIV